MKPVEKKPDPPQGAGKKSIRTLLVTGLCIFVGVLIVAGVIFIRTLFLLDRAPLAPEEPLSYPEEAPQTPGVPEPGDPPVSQKPAEAESSRPDTEPADLNASGPPAEQPPRPRQKGTLAFVIDDAGNNLEELEPFLRFPGPLTIAVLPGLPYSAEAARRIQAAGKELFLHQPMEALGGQNPGPGAIYSGMSPEAIRAVVEGNLAEIGPVAGINNHQGSKITRDPEAMETILTLCRERGISFLDSRTIADTVAPDVAKRLGIPIGERDVFVDNSQEKSAMIQCVEEGLHKAEQQGTAVLIGHTWSRELAATLEELYPVLVERGYSLATISRLMEDTG
ncbi:MAG: divergent polysaccharide deacetylase family protein [Treponema sp.]|nr:divergent polysaccharide deacetylase family protein [Treponema sp.]